MTQSALLPAETLTTGANPAFCIIWLHGLGADGNDFVPLVAELGLAGKPAVKFVFPHAPVRRVTVNNGYRMRAWYDLLALSGDNTANESDILASVDAVTRLIDHEVNQGFRANRILLAGFSQGGVIALHAALRYPHRLAGILALSTYLPFADSLLEQSCDCQSGLSVFSAHGTHDPVLPFHLWQEYVPLLEKSGYQVEAHRYAMQHSLCAEEVRDMSLWLDRILQNAQTAQSEGSD